MRKGGFIVVLPWRPLGFYAAIFDLILTMGQFWENVNQGMDERGLRKALLAKRVEGCLLQVCRLAALEGVPCALPMS